MMAQIFHRKKFSDYLGQEMALDDIIIGYAPDGGGLACDFTYSVLPTPTPTSNPTATPTVTPTNTPTVTPTNTTTTTITPTNTSTPTNTPTVTPTNTETPTPTPTSTSTAFSPLSIPNLKSWHDSSNVSSLTIISDEVDIWNDLSGNGYHLQAPTSSHRPSYSAKTLNNIAVVSSLTADKSLYRNTYGLDATQSGATIFVVGAQNPVEGFYGRFIDGDFSTQFFMGRENTNLAIGGGYFASASPYGSFASASDNQFYTICLRGTQTETTTIINDSVSGSPFSYSPSYADNGLAFFSTVSQSFYGTKDIAEVLVYSRELTSGEYTQVINYLRNKWQHY